MQNTVKQSISYVMYALLTWGILICLNLSNTAIAEKKTDNLEKSIIDIKSQIEASMGDMTKLQKALNPLRSQQNENIKTTNTTLEDIKKKLQEAYDKLNKNESSINTDHEEIDKLNKEILKIIREIRVNSTDLAEHKTFIEENSIRLYEILIQTNHFSDKVSNITEALLKIKNTDYKEEIKKEVYLSVDELWHLLASVLVFFAPLAFVISSNRDHFKPLSDGIAQHQGVILVTLGAFLSYFSLGFGLMYGDTLSGLIGIPRYLHNTPEALSDFQPIIPLSEFIQYQIGFAILAAMIVYMAVGRQLSSLWHLTLALFVAVILIPILGHWAWAGHFIAENKGWLENSGFIDQGGSLVVNGVAALFAFFIVLSLGQSDPAPADIDNDCNDPVYSSSSVLLLWLSWLGFTTGNLSIAGEEISQVMLNVGLAGSAGGLIAYLHALIFYGDQNRIAQGLSGFVTGLVAIAACAQNVTYLEAVVIGATAGILQNIGYQWLHQHVLHHQWQKRTASLVAIHGIGGIWGALCVALFMTDGNFSSLNMGQLIVQLKGIAIVLAYSFIMAKIMLFFLALRKKPKQITV